MSPQGDAFDDFWAALRTPSLGPVTEYLVRCLQHSVEGSSLKERDSSTRPKGDRNRKKPTSADQGFR